MPSLDLSREVKWWEEEQLRMLVLGSLFLQFVLFVGSFMRHVRALKSIMWLAFLGSDAVAIYALSTLFNRHKARAGSESDTNSPIQLEVLWAPILLHHLGGLHAFTAYSIEDNELWRRHFVTLVSQVTVAIYVFFKSWSGADKKLAIVTVLLFIIGVLKFIQKLVALKTASFNSIISSSAVYPRRRQEIIRKPTTLLCSSIQTYRSVKDAELLREEEEHDISLEQYIEEARKVARDTKVDPKTYFDVNDCIEKRFVDLSSPYSRRSKDMSSFLMLKNVERTLHRQLAHSFGMIYSGGMLQGFTFPGLLMIIFLPFVSLTSLVLFRQSHKGGYKESDIKVTYILLWCATVLEFMSVFSLMFSYHIWSFTIALHNIVSFATRRSMPTKLMKVFALFGLTDYINKHWYIRQQSSSYMNDDSSSTCYAITQSVVQHLRDGWKQFIVDAPSYKKFNNFRGQWTMSRHKLCDPRLLRSFELPFDLSVLVWHLATDLCLHHPRTSSSPTTNDADQEFSSLRNNSKVISDYMIYLLLLRPEMLLLGSRPGLFTTACDDIEIMLKYINAPPSRDERTIVQRILQAAQSPTYIGPWVFKAYDLAEGLMELLEDEEERWKVIQGVWLEMLCYSAGRCTGYLHIKSMGDGVEFLSYIWLILWYMGMETCADRLQRGFAEVGAFPQP